MTSHSIFASARICVLDIVTDISDLLHAFEQLNCNDRSRANFTELKQK